MVLQHITKTWYKFGGKEEKMREFLTTPDTQTTPDRGLKCLEGLNFVFTCNGRDGKSNTLTGSITEAHTHDGEMRLKVSARLFRGEEVDFLAFKEEGYWVVKTTHSTIPGYFKIVP